MFFFSRILVFDRLTDESFWQIEFRNEDGTHDRIIIDIENGPKFLISAKVRKGSMSFGIMDIHGMYFCAHGDVGGIVMLVTYSW